MGNILGNMMFQIGHLFENMEHIKWMTKNNIWDNLVINQYKKLKLMMTQCMEVFPYFQSQVGVQDDGFPILSVDKPGWWWVVHTCNDIYKLEPPVKEDTVKSGCA